MLNENKIGCCKSILITKLGVELFLMSFFCLFENMKSLFVYFKWFELVEVKVS